jgi:glucose-6-phosphate 1-epimerase
MDHIVLKGQEVWIGGERRVAHRIAVVAGPVLNLRTLTTIHPFSVSSQSSSATVYLHGAHVSSWTSPSGCELLFMSEKAVFAPPKALRGGIPVCFPQFSDMGAMESQHGFARNAAFVVDEAAGDNSACKVTLLLDHTGSVAFPQPFQLRVSVEVRAPHGALVQRLRVTNPASAPGPLPFTAALHTYIRVGDIGRAAVEGLGPGGRFLDSTDGRVEKVDEGGSLKFDREVDRIYLSPPGPLVVVDGAASRRVRITTDGLVDAVVWNPWTEKAAALADFGDDEFKHMVCVEPAAVTGGGGVGGLGVGETWEGGQALMVE